MTKNMTKSVTIKDASEKLGVSIRTLRRQIKQGKYQSKLKKGKRWVTISVPNDTPMSQQNVTPPTQEQTAQVPSIPQGYVLLPQQTLDVLQTQVKELNSKLTKVMDTQQLLIERGLNLKQLPANGGVASGVSKTEKESDNVIVSNAKVSHPKHKKVGVAKTKIDKEVSQQGKDSKSVSEGLVGATPEPEKQKVKTIWETMGSWFK